MPMLRLGGNRQRAVINRLSAVMDRVNQTIFGQGKNR